MFYVGGNYVSQFMNQKKFNLFILIGLALIVSALSILAFSLIEIKTNELVLTNQNAMMDDLWRAEGAIQWWSNVYATIIVPATTILAVTGIATILSPRLFVMCKRKYVLNNFEKELQKACNV